MSGKLLAPTVLIVMDGIGLRKERQANAFALARTSNWLRLGKEYPRTELAASGLDVGLSPGTPGNDELGHLHLGAGRVVYQPLMRIGRAVESGEFFSNERLKSALKAARGQALHVAGLVSDGNVQSSMGHLLAVLKAASEFGLRQVYIHAFTDGRDTPPKSALTFIRQLESACLRFGVGELASISGRSFALDRDRRFERTARVYAAMTRGEGQGVLQASSAEKAVAQAYARGETDEFLQPTVIGDGAGVGRIQPGDSLLFFNFVGDRLRQLVSAFAADSFEGFNRGQKPKLSSLVTMTDCTAGAQVLFPDEPLVHVLGDVIAAAGLPQLRIAETEKFPHVTRWFNGGDVHAALREERVLVREAVSAESYAKRPEMQTAAVTAVACEKIRAGRHAFILVNLANADMVGHTGDLDAAIAAVETVDRALGELVHATLERRGRVLITSDHGNCETMVDSETGEPHTAHTVNPVPFMLVDAQRMAAQLRPGTLADVAPTVLELMGLPIPAVMTGRSLVTG